MQYRTVPKNGDRLSILGFGAMRLPGGQAYINEKEASRQILSSLDAGINYIDTAYPYHNGKSEPFLGKLLKQSGYRDRVRLATKLPHWSVSSPAEMERFLDEQLARLQVDQIDYYLIHNLTGKGWERCRELGVREFLDEALRKGKIRNTGFSYHGSAEDFPGIIDDYDWTLCQIQYNLLDTHNQAGTAGLRYAASRNLAVIIMEPLRGGNLAKTPPPGVRNLWSRSGRDWTPVEWSLRWLWNHPEVTVVLSGMNREEHIRENMRIASEAEADIFTDRDKTLVEEAAGIYRELMKAECTGCQYCMPCPKGVDIPRCFETWNSRHLFRDYQARFVYLAMLGGINAPQRGFASQCVQCGLCVKKCPQSLPIPDLLEGVKKDFEGPLTKPLLWIVRRVLGASSGNRRDQRPAS